MGLMGVPLPDPLKNAVDILKSKSEPPDAGTEKKEQEE